MGLLNDGFRTVIYFTDFPGVELWEVETSPPGASGGGPIDVTTMRNTTFRTFAPKTLKSQLQSGVVVAYDPAIFDSILAMTNVVQNIEVNFPDGNRWEFEGWLQGFEPQGNREGEQPRAQVVINNTGLLLGLDGPETDDIEVKSLSVEAGEGLEESEIETKTNEYIDRVYDDGGVVGSHSAVASFYSDLFGKAPRSTFTVVVRNAGVENVTDDIPVKLRRDDNSELLLDTVIEGGLPVGLWEVFEVVWDFEGLAPGEYNFTAFHEYTDDDATNDSKSVSFTIPEPAKARPGVETLAASEVDMRSMRLNGELFDMGGFGSVDVFFQYRETGASVWQETTPQTLTATGTFDALIEDLDTETIYEFRAAAEYED